MANITAGGRIWGDWTSTTLLPHYSGWSVSNGAVLPYLYSTNNQLEPLHTSTSIPATVPQVISGGVPSTSFYMFGGAYKVIGKVEINTVVVAGKWVYIFPEGAPSLCLAAQYTDTTGNFSFVGLAAGKYKVYAMDPNFNYNGKLYENISAVAM